MEIVDTKYVDVKIEDGKLKVVAEYGIQELVEKAVAPAVDAAIEKVKELIPGTFGDEQLNQLKGVIAAELAKLLK